ncbi:MAG: hypothetical protein ISR41_07260 [Puniceicoccaceae bacterium]|nr:hypothetical protein [Puniceicoccaceae bacterium]
MTSPPRATCVSKLPKGHPTCSTLRAHLRCTISALACSVPVDLIKRSCIFARSTAQRAPVSLTPSGLRHLRAAHFVSPRID